MNVLFIRILSVCLLASFSISIHAQTKVVVIPMGGDAQPLQNVITVSKENGDFSDPVAAMNSITDASEDNPYLVVIGAGVFTVDSPVIMQEWVSIQGSGQATTKITGAISTSVPDATSAVLVGANNAELSNLSIVNNGDSSGQVIGIYNNSASPDMMHVTAHASGSNGGAPGLVGYGVYNISSSPNMLHVKASAELLGTSWTTAYGIYNQDSSSTMVNCTAEAAGGGGSRAVWLTGTSSPVISHLTAVSTGGVPYSVGLTVANGASAYIQDSSVQGETAGLDVQSESGRIVNTRIIGGVLNNATGTQCRLNYDADLNTVNC